MLTFFPNLRFENGNPDIHFSKNHDVTLGDLYSNEFIKEKTEFKPQQGLVKAIIEEHYDNVDLEEETKTSNMDVYSEKASLALNGLLWSSETNLSSEVNQSSSRYDLCTNEPILVPSYCASLPDHYYRSKPAKAERKMFKNSSISALKPKRK